MKFIRNICLLLLLDLFSCSAMASSSLMWGSTGFLVRDDLNNALPGSVNDGTVGAWAQLLYAGANGVADEFLASGFGTSVDDVVVDTSYSWNGSFIGASAGKFSYQTAGTSDILNGNYYVRVYNVPNPDYGLGNAATIPVAATHYYESSLHSYTYTSVADAPDQWSFTGGANQQTLNVVSVPEPSSMILLSLGMIVAGVRRRK